jgi:hypothetical protein
MTYAMRFGVILLSLAGLIGLGGCDGGDGDGEGDAGDPQADAGAGGDDDAGSTPAALRDVTLSITGADPHMGQLVDIRIVDEWDNLVARGVIAGLPSGAYDFALPHSTPEGAHRLDFFADLSGNDAYDAPPADHAWRMDVAADGDAVVSFVHNTDFTDIASPAIHQGGDLTLDVSGVDPHVGQLFEVRVIRTDNDQLVGRYVLPAITEAAFTVVLEDILDDGVEYQVDYFADLSDNGSYDAPPTDHAWRDVVTADASGATVDFVHNTDFTDVEF